MSEKNVRWQGYCISQLTLVINMFFGLAVGSIAFTISLLDNDKFLLQSCIIKRILIGSIICFCLAVFTSCFAVISRLFDFQNTAKKVRTDEKSLNENKDLDESAIFKYKYKFWGRLTWRLFWIQVITLGLGLLGLIVVVITVYSDKLN